MSKMIGEEAGFWLYAVLVGAQLMLLYDLLRIFRRLFPHKNTAIGIEDFCYWMVSGCLIFRMLYRFNHGVIRWFAVFGMAVGMLFYHLTVSRLFVRYAVKLLNRLIRLVSGPVQFLFKKIRKFLTKINRKQKKFTIFLKKKLKREKKEGKIKIMNKDRSGQLGNAGRQKKKKTTEQADIV